MSEEVSLTQFQNQTVGNLHSELFQAIAAGLSAVSVDAYAIVRQTRHRSDSMSDGCRQDHGGEGGLQMKTA